MAAMGDGMGSGAGNIIDVSFAGSTITIGGYSIKDFMDDQNPIDVQDTESCNIEWSCNARMIRTVKPSAVIISVTVIPGSQSDKDLRTLWKDTFSNSGSVQLNQADKALDCVITCGKPGMPSYQFTMGTPIAGAAALTVNGQGKMGGNTYTFAFEQTI